ncbi:SDR family NAD(P)-dependent oxidoreductase [Streptodolium elevatio]|uniref:SDR family NAD(P)-dependent oxidoreductase n=1 Tax=Streptodolium elevatio TaxID=3157996 RepID=A0ABV3DTU3_9ACTN
MFELDGKRARVTGAGKTSARVSRAWHAKGAAVAANGYHADRARRVADEITVFGGRALAVPFDVAELSAVTDGFAAPASALGPTDVLVNNAGTGGPNERMQQHPFRGMPTVYWQASSTSTSSVSSTAGSWRGSLSWGPLSRRRATAGLPGGMAVARRCFTWRGW